MIKNDMTLYDLAKNKIVVEEIQGDTIHATKYTEVHVSWNAGGIKKTQVNKARVMYDISDLGIRLFYALEDVSNPHIDEDSAYFKNKEAIVKNAESKRNELLEKAKAEEPKVRMSPAEKIRILANYHIKAESDNEEEAFYRNRQVDYFARMDFDTEFYIKAHKEVTQGHYYDKYYLCKNLPLNYEGDTYIDWRSSIAEVYYQSDKTNFSTEELYSKLPDEQARKTGNACVYNSELMLKRKFKFDPLQYVNLYIAGQKLYSDGAADSFLLEIIEQNRLNNRLSDIIMTIQSNQNSIIRQVADKNIIVQGCAGSGKTMIMLHRLSYLKYNNKLPQYRRIKIITPNELFRGFIDDLSHVLELDEIPQMTMNSYYKLMAEKYQSQFSQNANKHDENVKVSSIEVNCIRETLKKVRNYSLIIESSADDSKQIEYMEFCLSNEGRIAFENSYQAHIDNINTAIDIKRLQSIAVRVGLYDRIKSARNHKQLFDECYELCLYEILNKNQSIDKQIKLLDDEAKRNIIGIEYINNAIFCTEEIVKRLSVSMQWYESSRLELGQIKSAYKQYALYNMLIERAKQVDDEIGQNRARHVLRIETQSNSMDQLEYRISQMQSKLTNLKIWNVMSRKRVSQELKLIELEHGYAWEAIINLKNELIQYENFKKAQLQQILTANNFGSTGVMDSTATCAETVAKIINPIFDEANTYLVGKLGIIPTIIDDALKTYNNCISKQYLTQCNEVLSAILVAVTTITEMQLQRRSNYEKLIKALLSSLIDIARELDVWINNFKTANAESKAFAGLFEYYGEKLDSINKTISSYFTAIRDELKDLEKLDRSLQLEREGLLHAKLIKEENDMLESNARILERRGSFVIVAFEELMKKYRNLYGVETKGNGLLKHEYVILLTFYYLHCGKLLDQDSLLFVDEGQDYHPSEYRLLLDINGNQCHMNIFGDVNQLLIPSDGTSSWKDLNIQIGAAYYELNENYRNTVEINDYINKKFGHKHTSIG